jgi:predicted GH43/DUF377 family glycosyl hydrolase
MLKIDWSQIKNPIIDKEPKVSVRDPALHYHEGTFYLFYTAVERRKWQYFFYVDLVTTQDLVHWTAPQRVILSDAGYSSPGNIIRVKNNCRLWLLESDDLKQWGTPRMIKPEGCTALWSKETRQIDPFLLVFENKYYCFYKSSGQLGLLVSDDLLSWIEASPNHPLLSPKEIPDHPTMENVCVIPQQNNSDGFMMFFSPCYQKRGIGVAYSSDLLHWSFDHYLQFPKLPWAHSGPTAPSILDGRDLVGKWLMAFHGDLQLPHHARMGLAWSEDLVHWQT